MSIITLQYVFSTGATIIASQHNANNQTIYNDYNGNVTAANLAANSAIPYSNLSLNNSIKSTDLLSTTVIPVSNLPVGTAVGNIVQLVSGTTAALPAVSGVNLTGLNYGLANILNYGTSSSTSTAVAQTNLKIAYGTVSVGTLTTVDITNLPFTSSSTYAIATSYGNTSISATNPIATNAIGGSSFSIQNTNATFTIAVSWITIGY